MAFPLHNRVRMSQPRRLPFMLLLAWATASIACVGGGAIGDEGRDSGQPDRIGIQGDAAPGQFATEVDASVLTDAVTTVALESLGDGLDYPWPPAGTACRRYAWRYTLARETGELAWERCAVAGMGANVSDFVPESGSRTLTESERTTALEAVRAVRVAPSDWPGCGADKSTVLLEVRAERSSLTYGDDFYVCLQRYEYYVRSGDVDALTTTLKSLADN